MSTFAQQPIGIVKSLIAGTVATTTGTVSNDWEYGYLRYIQDSNAGIALYSSSISGLHPGDSIIVTGVVSTYHDEIQLSPITSFTVVSSNRPLTPFLEENIKAISQPDYTSRVVQLNCVNFNSCESNFSEGPFVAYDQHGQSFKVILNEAFPFANDPVPHSGVDLSGIWTFSDNQYKLLLRGFNSTGSTCHLIEPPSMDLSQGDVRLSWNNLSLAHTWIEYGTEDFDNAIEAGTMEGDFTHAFNSLQTGFIYKARLGQENANQDTFYSPVALFSMPSEGPEIQVFFNHSVDASFSDGSSPVGASPSTIELSLIALIDQAVNTLDVAMYNTGSANIVAAVKRADQRGVQVRYIAESSTTNSALTNVTSFPIYYRDADGIMHNKFAIIDAYNPANATLWTGSTNWTTTQLSSDPNHAYIIHDQALALNYEREFDEMWGTQLDHNDGQTGENKTDNTSHLFRFNGKLIESYFSPSDEPDCHILNAIHSAQHQIQIGLLLLTSQDLIDEIVALHQNGVDVRVILEDEESSTNAVAILRNEGIPLAIHTPGPIYHHKYAIIDEGYPDSDPMVITGSHNWTYSADHINDENTLIVHDQSFTNIFRQEFEARWKELEVTAVKPVDKNNLLIYPNPSSGEFLFTNPYNDPCMILMMDLNGKRIQQFVAEPHTTLNLVVNDQVTTGYYILKCTWSAKSEVAGMYLKMN